MREPSPHHDQYEQNPYPMHIDVYQNNRQQNSYYSQEEQDLGVYEDNSESSRYVDMAQQESAREEHYENFEASDKDYSYDSEEESAPVT